jgi:hypothetical protein
MRSTDPILAIETISFFKGKFTIEVCNLQSIIKLLEVDTTEDLHFVDIYVRRILTQDYRKWNDGSGEGSWIGRLTLVTKL